MRAGQLRESITIQQAVAAMDINWGNQAQPNYQDLATVRASVIAIDGNEAATTDKAVMSSLTYKVSVRFRDDIDSTCRIKWGSKILDIVNVIDPDGHRHELHIKAVENPTNG